MDDQNQNLSQNRNKDKAKDSGGYLPCLMCDADVLVSKEDVGEPIYCSFCQLTMKLKMKKSTKNDEEELYLEEDF